LLVSLITSGVLLMIWVRSYVATDAYHCLRISTSTEELVARRAGIMTGLGGVGFYFDYVYTGVPSQVEPLRMRINAGTQLRPVGFQSSPTPRYPIRWGSDDGTLASLGLHWRSTLSDTNGVYRRRISFALPFWLLFALTAGYPMFRYIAGVLRRQREDREALGLCPRCGVPLKNDFTKCPGCDRPLQVVQG
jgi:hypothetical protein